MPREKWLPGRTRVCGEAERGRIGDRPELRKMIDETRKPNAPFQEILSLKTKREHAVDFKSMLRRKGVRIVSISERADYAQPASC